ncbi:MAG: sigma-70 family RNA polymerase sigma factor [Corallococcus sp.]|nr:sigma-70 family RNA polymerase sigma factor [Corallococcus sp.]MCM1359368.1 sigma-70 family RNA polymerase sigma factor [Corallococcus sp.]MCM1394811.1 sigma-70 family RNA polymerase sigma factor [Corallococcus sp.]
MENTIKKAKAGDQSAMNEIFENYKGLIRSVANKFFLVGGNKDDLLQEGMLGLFHAVTNYDESKGNFPSFVKLCVARQITDAVKSDTSYKNKPLATYEELSSAESLFDEHTPLEDLLQKEYSQKIARIIDEKLTPTERQALRLYSEGYSYGDIAQKLQKTAKSVDGALQRARKKLQTYLFEE